jgi:hypothetical protein
MFTTILYKIVFGFQISGFKTLSYVEKQYSNKIRRLTKITKLLQKKQQNSTSNKDHEATTILYKRMEITKMVQH